ncbi:MAG TPA: hypothetical protein O0X97_02335 [Methanocorpusculum sp.]|nr:hypothetical protein [Methanocorpusculum sp.]
MDGNKSGSRKKSGRGANVCQHCGHKPGLVRRYGI